MNRLTKRRLQRVLSWAGIHVRPALMARPFDLTDVPDINPRAAAYEARERSVLIRVPIEKCVHMGVMGFPCDRQSPSPFISTLNKYLEGECQEYKGSPLELYYQTCPIHRVIDLLGIDSTSCDPFLMSSPEAVPALWLWMPGEPGSTLMQARRTILAENQEHGGNIDWKSGHSNYGPVSAQKGELEFNRLTKTLDSIKKKGFIVDPNGINNLSGIALFSGENWKVFIVTGQHRIAALSALGYSEITLQMRVFGLGGIVDRKDAEYWPTVRRGIISRRDAERIFDRLFEAEQPLVAEKWLRWHREQRGMRLVKTGF